MSYPQDRMSSALRTRLQEAASSNTPTMYYISYQDSVHACTLLAYLYDPWFAKQQHQHFTGLYLNAVAWVQEATREKEKLPPTDDRSHTAHTQPLRDVSTPPPVYVGISPRELKKAKLFAFNQGLNVGAMLASSEGKLALASKIREYPNYYED